MNIYVIIGKGFDTESVIKEIKEEGYTHNFCLNYKLTYKERIREMAKADEVWCFGKADGYDDYEYAKSKGYDIWIMG